MIFFLRGLAVGHAANGLCDERPNAWQSFRLKYSFVSHLMGPGLATKRGSSRVRIICRVVGEGGN